MKAFFSIVLFLTFGIANLSAQGLSYGFKAGLNFSQLNGPSETDNQGSSLEEFKFNTGFHVGAAFIYKFTDLYGAKAELLFSQKGGKISYDGPAWQDYPTTNAATYIEAVGTKVAFLNISNSYIDIPILVYGRILPWLEISGGVNAAILINSTASGENNFKGVTGARDSVATIISLDHNYLKDDPVNYDELNLADFELLPIQNHDILLPNQTAGAFYDFPTRLGKMYRMFDLGLNAGVSFFVNSSLFIGYRFNYGLLDVSNNSTDVAKSQKNGNSYITRADNDKNMSMQVSIGFSF